MDEKEACPPILDLLFRKGDLIAKQGDYGISIYRIKSGKVGIYIESGEREVCLAILGRGEIIGEMTFLNQSIEPRFASARALEETRVEVWHPDRLRSEYQKISPIIKYISDQVLRRLARMNKAIGKLDTGEKKPSPESELSISQRLFYRKDVNISCEYRSLDTGKSVWLKGDIRNLSLNGLGLQVPARNNLNFPHDPGKAFGVRATLPNGREVEMDARIVTAKKARVPGRLDIGLALMDITEETRKILGFFLMP
jgi:Cyclic nucleotide-binding domain/PilZ domain